MGWLLFQTVISLVAVLALMFGVVWILKRFVRLPGFRNADIVEVEVLGQRVLQPKQAVFVIKVLNKIMVVGAGEGGMRTLSTIEDEDVLRQITAARIHDETQFTGFTRRARTSGAAPQTFAEFLATSMRPGSSRRRSAFTPFSWFGRRGN
jgi:flagellar biogenesis protein FliO